ncbi:hypothetical protein BOO71_0013633 [Deinococcus marmoris]|uniref:Uncharacterized protein n=1 Tax=Deinococcus marmoris TaxID=249408 RepID=A0A1U7NSD9_9DEIO|nr:hypothetical protein BOO71_0013633 [Deinococcus marmoris]
MATLSDVQLTAPGCQGFQSVTVPAENAGAWYPEDRIAILVRDVPATLIPCAAGELTFKAQGREGKSAYPLVTFKQNGRVIQTVQTGEEFTPVRVPVGATPLSVTVTNAYGVTLADRNLNLEHLGFVPRRP